METPLPWPLPCQEVIFESLSQIGNLRSLPAALPVHMCDNEVVLCEALKYLCRPQRQGSLRNQTSLHMMLIWAISGRHIHSTPVPT